MGARELFEGRGKLLQIMNNFRRLFFSFLKLKLKTTVNYNYKYFFFIVREISAS